MRETEQYEHPILLVEDNPDDVLITKRAFSKGKIRNKLYIVNNGVEAVKFLNKEEEYKDVPIPSLIMLDINMPLMNGFDVLREIKKNEKLRRIPIIMLTTSERDKDIDTAYSLGANNYIVKPVSFQKFIDVVVNVQEYWLQISKIPSN